MTQNPGSFIEKDDLKGGEFIITDSQSRGMFIPEELNEEQEKYVKIAKYLPFENRIYALEKVRRRGLSVVGQEVAKELNDLNKEIVKSISGVKKMDSVEMVLADASSSSYSSSEAAAYSAS